MTMNTHTCYSAVIVTSLSLSLIACSAPTLKPENVPLGTVAQQQPLLSPSWTTQDPGFLSDYQFALLSAPHFNIQTYLDSVKSKGKLTLIHGIVNPVDITLPANLKQGEYFSLLASVSKPGEFEVRPHPTQAHTLNIKPLKPSASALLTLVAGSERVVLELETLANIPSETQYLSALKDKQTLSLINGMVNTIDLTAAENLTPGDVYSLLTRVSKAGEFEVKPHPTQAGQITIKPLKSGARANLTLIAGKQRVELNLETIDSGKVALGDNLTLVFPDNLTLKKDEVREISVEGIAQGQFIFIGYKNSNPQGFRVETPKDKPNVVRVTALQDEATADVTVLIGQTTRTLTFTSINVVQETAEPLISINSPATGTAFNHTDDIKLVAQIQNPAIGTCTAVFKDQAGNILPTHPISSETTATQVSQTWKASDRDKISDKSIIQAIYTCSTSSKEIKSGFTEINWITPLPSALPSPILLKATPVSGQEFTQILLEFEPLPGIFDYKIYANDQLIGSLTSQATDKRANYNAQGLSPGTAYIFKVDAIQNGLSRSTGTVKGNTWSVSTGSSGGGGNSVPIQVSVPPSISSLSASNGTIGSALTIFGTGFDSTPGNNTVRFGTTTATVNTASPTSLNVTVPTGIFGTQNVAVTVAGQTNVGTNNYAVRPAIASFNPTSAPIGGSFTINGSGFDPTVGNNTVSLGGTAVTVTGATTTALTVTMPNKVANNYGATVQVGALNSASSNMTTLSTITTFAGTGIAGFSGDAAAAHLAQLNQPWGIAINDSGHLVIADSANHRVRFIPGSNGPEYGSARTSGFIYTVAGDGTAGFAGDSGVGTAGRLNTPKGVSLSNTHHIQIVDSDNARIRLLAGTTGSFFNLTVTAGRIYTLTGTGTVGAATNPVARFAVGDNQNGVEAVARHLNGTIYADIGNQIIRLASLINGTNLGVTVSANNLHNIAGDRYGWIQWRWRSCSQCKPEQPRRPF
jgi:hypothetical protein